MTDTSSPGASADARVHGTADALAGVSITQVDRPIGPAEAEALFAVSGPAQAAPASVVIPVSTLVPNLTALVRWGMQGGGVWLVGHGMSQAREAAFEPIATGLALSAGALGWSWLQKQFARRRIVAAAKADPATVVLK